MTKINNFTEGKILSPLIRFAVPILLAQLLQTAYSAVDMLVVGQFGSTADVSAVSTGGWIVTLALCFMTGLAMGMTVLIGQAIGAGDPSRAGRIIGTAVLLFGAFCIVLMIALIALAPLLAAMMRSPAEAFDGTVLYIRICAGGLAFITAYHVIGSMFRGIGDSVMPLVTVAIACVFNIAGDLLLAGYFRMGVKGVAIATVFAQGVSVLASMLIVKKRGLPFAFGREHLRFDPQIAKELLGIGIPTSAQDVLVTFSFIAIASIVNSLGLVLLRDAGTFHVFRRHVGFYGAELRRRAHGPGGEGLAVWHRGVAGRGHLHVRLHVFPGRYPCLLVRGRKSGRGSCRGGLSEGLCHRLHAHELSVLL